MRALKLFFIGLLLLPFLCSAQTEIKLQFKDITADSIFIKTTTDNQKMENILSKSFNKELVYKNKKPLNPGIYWIFKDSTMLDAFLISSPQTQTFSIQLSDSDPVYSGSSENINYHIYAKNLDKFDERLRDLDQEYSNAQKSMPQYMLRVLADSLTVKAQRINAEKEDYQKQIARENPGTLLASIIGATISIPQPPQTTLNNRSQLQQYYFQHYFDNFPWNDPRIFKTPVGVNKIKEYCSLIYQCNNPELDHFVLEAIQTSKVDTASYFYFFDQLEKIIGDHGSPYRIERIYIPMLKDMLTLPKLPALRERHCNYELRVIDQNNVGDNVSNFIFVTNTGDTTSLYDIQSEYLLLYLQHPTCPTCQRVRKMIADFPTLNKAIASGRMKVLTVYFEDDAQIWSDFIHSTEANPNYMHGWNFDQTILDKTLFDTRAIPYMFLLDKSKKVIVKNVSENLLEDEIKKLNLF